MNNNGSAVVPVIQNIIVINIVNLSTDSVHTANLTFICLKRLLRYKAGIETVTAEQMSGTLANIPCAHR